MADPIPHPPVMVADDSPRALRVALWCGLAPKIGVGVWVVLLLIGALAGGGAWVGCSWVVMAAGGLVGLVGGTWVLLRCTSATARTMGRSGVLWGAILWALIVALGGCAVMMGRSYRNRFRMMDQSHLMRVAQVEVAYCRQHPGQPVDLQVLCAQDKDGALRLDSQFSESGRGASENPIRASDFIFVPGITDQSPKSALLVFIDPVIPFYRDRGEVPVAFADGSGDTLPIPELEARIKRQTGLSVAEIVRRQREGR